MALRNAALSKYRDLIEQGFSPAQANAHVRIEFGFSLPRTWQTLAEREPVGGLTW